MVVALLSHVCFQFSSSLAGYLFCNNVLINVFKYFLFIYVASNLTQLDILLCKEPGCKEQLKTFKMKGQQSRNHYQIQYLSWQPMSSRNLFRCLMVTAAIIITIVPLVMSLNVQLYHSVCFNTLNLYELILITTSSIIQLHIYIFCRATTDFTHYNSNCSTW